MNRINLLSLPPAMLVLLLGITLPASPGHADDERSWQFFLNASRIESSGGQLDVNTGASRVRVETDAGGSFGAGARYRFRPQMDFEVGLLHSTSSDLDVSVTGASFFGFDIDSLAFDAFTAGVNFHLTPQRRADVYVGPLLAYMDYQDLSGALNLNLSGIGLDLTGVTLPFGIDLQSFLSSTLQTTDPIVVSIPEIRLNSELVVGAVVGVDVPIGQGNWIFNAHARYLHASAEPDLGISGLDLDFKPLLLGLGFGYTF